ncbi:MAG: hypothetical protein CMO81_10605 [Waddliaceae bacterium]|nr:hypothetical protein [Waddliaceae bacterium]
MYVHKVSEALNWRKILSFSVTIQRVRTSFNSTFWIANSLELFERFAFYGSKAILVVYLANRLDLGVEAAASLAGMYAGIMYSLPLVAGVFVDRYGFRKTLAACFFLFALGYFLIALPCLDLGAALVQSVGPTPYITAVLVLTSIGGSLIKPCIVGTVAKTTVPETASLGYSIYYSIVNIGGALGPIFALQIRHLLGIEYVLVMASVVSACLFLGTLAFFREPDKPLETVETAQSASFTKIFKDMLMVFSNIKFITFLTLLSSFYLMF